MASPIQPSPPSNSDSDSGDSAACQNPHDFAKLQHGCDHYRRRCKIRAPCCDQIFSCRHCHNEATSSHENPKERHEIVRHDIKRVICSICDSEQMVSQDCSNCGVRMGEYFCNICKFYDDEISKNLFHCDECGICRVGGLENYFHCQKCGSCYAVDLRDNHLCVEGSMKCFCPVCYEYLFDSVKQARVMKCGHTIHQECFNQMILQHQYRCPICSKTLFDMSTHWSTLDVEIEAMEMPEEYKYEVTILCNDCNTKGKVPFHILGHKCSGCGSYNTRRILNPEGE